MTRTLMLATAMAGVLGAAAAPAFAQGAGMALDPLRASVAGALRSRGLPTEGVAGMPLARLAAIKGLLNSSDSEEQTTLRVRTLLQGAR